LAGVDLGYIRCKILANRLEKNTSLKALHLARKKLGEEEGMALARALLTNRTLEKLELEGNALGSKSA